MIIRTDKSPASSQVRSKPLPQSKAVSEEPAWVDAMVPSVPLARNSALSVGAGAVAGLGVGFLLDQLALGGAAGAVAGAAGAVAIHLVASSRREQAKQGIVARHDQQRRDLQGELGVPKEPNRSYGRAKVYTSEKNLLVEFPATGSFLSATNTGPKRPVVWEREGDAYGSPGEALGRLNQGIESTDLRLSRPLEDARFLEPGNDIVHFDPLGPKDQQVNLSADGKLTLSHSGTPEGGVTYDLQNGNVDSPRLVVRDGKVEKLDLSEQTFRRQEHVGYRYEGGQFEQVGEGKRRLRPTLALQHLGHQDIAFPTLEGANEVLTRETLRVTNEGVFRSLRQQETVLANYLPEGAEWTPEPKEKKQSETLEVTLKGGAVLSQVRGHEALRDGRDSYQVKLNGETTFGLQLSVNQGSLVIHQPRTPQMRQGDNTYTQTVGKDGTITWRSHSYDNWTQFVFGADGSVKGSYGSDNSDQSYDRGPDGLPELRPDGTLQFQGYQQRLFVAPEEIR